MKKVAIQNLYQLKELLININSEDYKMKLDVLSGSSIGEHMRHILEFYLLLVSGAFTGIVNYDKRERNKNIETETKYAIATIDKIINGIEVINLDELITFEADYTQKGSSNNKVKSSLSRELAYCVEHSIHHQALIKAGLVILNKKELTDKYFGVAYSTIRYRNNSCAQ